MLGALPRPIDAPVEVLLLRSIARKAPSVTDALACLEPAEGAVRLALARALCTPGRPDHEADRIAAAVVALPQDPRADLEECLVALGRSREGSASRLIAARGLPWARTPEGRAVLDGVARRHLADLASAPERELRLLCCSLLSGGEPAETLPLLDGLMRDADRAVRQDAITAVGLVKHVSSAPPLARAYTVETHAPTREILKRALATLPGQAVAAELAPLTRAEAASDRLAAVMGLEVVARAECVAPLVAALRDADRSVAVAAAKAIVAFQGRRGGDLSLIVAHHAPEVGAVSRETQDAELQRLTRSIYVKVRSRTPEQDAPRAPAPAAPPGRPAPRR